MNGAGAEKQSQTARLRLILPRLEITNKAGSTASSAERSIELTDNDERILAWAASRRGAAANRANARAALWHPGASSNTVAKALSRLNARLAAAGFPNLGSDEELDLSGFEVDLQEFFEAADRTDYEAAVALACATGQLQVPLSEMDHLRWGTWLRDLQHSYGDLLDTSLMRWADEVLARTKRSCNWRDLVAGIELVDLRQDLCSALDAAGHTQLDKRMRAIRQQRAKLYEQLRDTEDTDRPRLRTGTPCAVANASPLQLGVRPASLGGDAYGWTTTIERPALDERVTAAIADAADSDKLPMTVVLMGVSGAGKTRTLYEALCRLIPTAIIIAPETIADLPKAVDMAERVAAERRFDSSGSELPTVLWLEDLETFVSLEGGLNASLVRRLAHWGGIIVAATVGGKGLQLIPESERSRLNAPLQDVLDQAELISVDPYLQSDDLERAAEHYEPAVVEAFRLHGPGAYFIAAPQLRARCVQLANTDPSAFAVLEAACRWRRSGIIDAVPEAVLLELWKAGDPGVKPTRREFRQACARACRPAFRDVRPMWWTDRGYAVHDVVAETSSTQISDIAWSAMLRHATPGQAFDLGGAAWAANHHERATAAFEKAKQEYPVVSVNVGLLLAGAGDVPAAKAVFEELLESDDPLTSSLAALNVGQMLVKLGEIANARRALERAAESDTQIAPLAALELATLLHHCDDVPGAYSAYWQAIQSAHPYASPLASLGLGRLYRDVGEVEAAKVVFGVVRDSGIPRHAPIAVLQLAILSEQAGDLAEARNEYDEALRSAHPEAAPEAALRLGMLLETAGEVGPALEAYQQAIDSGHPAYAPKGALSAGQVLEGIRNLPAARRMYELASASNNASIASWATFLLGKLTASEGDADTARSLFAWVIDSGDPDAVPWASLYLGGLLRNRKDPEARGAFERAIHSNNIRAAGLAGLELGHMLAEAGDMSGAEEAYRTATVRDDAEVAASAGTHLGNLLASQGRTPLAHAAYQAAVELRGRSSAVAAMQLGVSLVQNGDTAGAKAAYEAAIECDDPRITPMATSNLADVLLREGQVEDAVVAYRRVVESNDSIYGPRAADIIGKLRNSDTTSGPTAE